MMKNNILIFAFCFFSAVTSFAQITTDVFILDLGSPNQNSLISSDSTKKSLVIPAKNLLAFNLINGNPYKYKYVINHTLLNFFEGQYPIPFDSVSKKSDEGPNRGPAGSNDTLDVVYQSKAIGAYNIIKENKEISVGLSIDAIEPKSEEDDVVNIIYALKVLDKKSEDLSSDLQNYVASITAEDFLNLEEFGKKRSDYNATYVKLRTEMFIITQEATDFPQVSSKFSNFSSVVNARNLSIIKEISRMFQVQTLNYISPIDVNGKNIDVVEIKVQRFDKSAENPVPEEYNYHIWVKGGVKIDISAGLFLTSLVDSEYYTRDSLVVVDGMDETQKIIHKQNKGNYDFGFGSSINISLRGGSWARPALGIGALFTANQKFQLFSGIGIILGKEERVILHAGIAMGKITKIIENYKSDGSTSYDLGTDGVVPTIEKFSFGHFFGITYNFSTPRKLEKLTSM